MTARAGASERTPGAWLFLGPALGLILVFFVLPVAAAFALSFTDFDIYALASPANLRLVGLRQYGELASDPLFWKALRNTLYFGAVGGPLTVVTALGAALLVNAALVRMKGFFRTVLFAPVVTTLVAVGLVWRYLYKPRFGLLNHALSLAGLSGPDWLGDPAWAMPALIALANWKNFGYNMVVFVAGLQSVPEELYEAARIDGAGAWQRFRHVTLPMLGPTLVFVAVTSLIGYLQVFAEPYVLTQGGPLKATLTLSLHMYEQGFRWWNIGTAAALAVVLFVVILGATLLQLRLRKSAP